MIRSDLPLLQRLTRDTAPPEVSRPAPDRLISGDPVHTTWAVEARNGIYCGLWQSTPGVWRVAYAEWEYCHILQGLSVVTDASGTRTELRAGDSLILRPGFSGSWAVLETTLKDYVIRE